MTTENKGALVALKDARDQAIAILSDNFARDIIDVDEFERRITLAHAAQSLAELTPLTSDLEKPAQPAPVPSTAMVPASQVTGQQSLVAIMGGTRRSGRWTVPRQLRTFSVMGGIELDFREAVFGPGVTDVHVTSVMGGVLIIVPPTLQVEMNGSAIMGGFEHCERTSAQLDENAPRLRIDGFVIMGGVAIETRLPGESEHDAHRRRKKERKRARKALPAHE